MIVWGMKFLISFYMKRLKNANVDVLDVKDGVLDVNVDVADANVGVSDVKFGIDRRIFWRH